ncbi:MAG: SulP family inorganic anion transporter [Parvibaculum sp.]
MRQPKILTTMRNYSRATLWADLMAGGTVALVALPLSLAIAIASGADPANGLVTAIIGGFFVSAFGGSRVQIGGPTGAFIVVVYGIIHQHGYEGLVLATFMASLILLVAGYFRAGRLITYVPEAVVNGFTIGIAVVIAASQLKDFLGLTVAEVPAEFLAKLETLWAVRETLNPAALAIALVTLGLIVGLRRIAPRFPGLFVAVIVTSALAAYYSLGVDTIYARFGALPASLPVPAMPVFSLALARDLLPSAITIAFLAGVESLLSAMVADRMIGGHHRPNAELMAQGVANLASASVGGMPVTGAIARTATNVRAGGQTPVAGIFHALVILAMMMFAGAWVGQLALPALAALLMLTAWNMSEPHNWKTYWANSGVDRFLLILTMILTVFVDLTVAISVGVSIGLASRMLVSPQNPDEWTPPDR